MRDTRSSERPRVAILGTGKMGSAIARRLATVGLDLVLWNRTRTRAEALGVGMVADTPAAAVRDVDIVISSLTGPEAVRTVYLGAEGALTLGCGKHFIEMSTAGADLPAQIQPKVAAAGGTLVDAPILGAPPFVLNGQATVLASGADDDVNAVLPLLRHLGAVRHVGALGSASRLKLLANSMLADVILAAGELQVAGEAVGLNAGDVFWVLERLVPSLEARRAGLVDDHHTPALFALRDLRKDVEFAFALFQRTAARTPITGRARELVAAAAAVAPDADITALAKPYRDRERSLENGHLQEIQSHDEGAAISAPRHLGDPVA